MSRRTLTASVAVVSLLLAAWMLWPATEPLPEPDLEPAAQAPVRTRPSTTVRLTRPAPLPDAPSAAAEPRAATPARPRRRTIRDLDEAEAAERLSFWEERALHKLLEDCLGGVEGWEPSAYGPGTGMQISTVVDDAGLNELGLTLHGDVAESAEELEGCLRDSAWTLDWPPFDGGELLEQTTLLLGERDAMVPLGPPPIPDPLPTVYLVDGEYLSEEEFLERQARE